MQAKKLIALICLAALAVVVLILAGRMALVIPAVYSEARSTPTPTPVYGNVMIITPDPNAPTPAPVLKNGSEGDQVKLLQSRLQSLGYYSGQIDGQFGPGTQGAVRTFQQQHGLDDDGVVGPDTSTMLYSDAAKPCATPTPTLTPIPTVTPSPQPTAAAAAVVDSKPYVRPDGLPLLVNRLYPLPEDYQPYDLVNMAEYCDPSVVKIKYSDTLAEREAVDALLVMLRAAQAEGIQTWQISAAYRDVAYQQQLFDKQVREYEKKDGFTHARAVSATRKTVADPGTSEHHIGTVFDITVPGVSFAGTKQAEWLAANCWQYGFILRYAKDKEAITGFVAEAWHFRYVGAEHAIPMRNENLCLEEYIEAYGLYIEDE